MFKLGTFSSKESGRTWIESREKKAKPLKVQWWNSRKKMVNEIKKAEGEIRFQI